MSLTRKRRRPLRLHWAVALMPPPSPQVETGRRTRHLRCPPRLPRSFFLHDFAPPPPAIVRPWPRQRRRCGIPAVIRFDAVIVVVIVIVVIQGLDILCCGHRHLSRCAVSSLSLRRRLYRHAAATIAAPMPVSLCLSRASGWLLHRHLSRCTSASLVVPRCSATSLVAPPPLSLWRLTCAGWLSLRQLS